MLNKFDDIRPYSSEEIPAAMQRIAGSKQFEELAKYIFPGRNVEETRQAVRNIRTTGEFQQEVMYHVNRQFIDRSISEFTYDGLDGLDPEKNCLFVSNHRDIMLDSSLLQYLLHVNGFRTTEITFGSNLMDSQLAVDIGKANKMFKVIRSSNSREFIRNSRHLSEYIRHTLTEKGESVWIAQRNGRTKDGNDQTDPGIIKMFCMSRPQDLVESVGELNIVPVAISYEKEPCDILKTREVYLSRRDGKYVKQPGEDMNSILTGIRQPKGHVHISICPPLTGKDLAMDFKNPKEFYKQVAALIDKRIYGGYRLHAGNFIAFDLRTGEDTYFGETYTPDEELDFMIRFGRMLAEIDGDRETLRSIFLDIYATPVDNVINANK
ncbi:MAG: 1-acyl-sn-glycerol-3-phosphate acyltransferase [Tannerella sp.]|jgi:hypothetical protein|nr:1-acyl-sn-glycerol-3-phosphate acyltransferase [Tannerella sp.]